MPASETGRRGAPIPVQPTAVEADTGARPGRVSLPRNCSPAFWQRIARACPERTPVGVFVSTDQTARLRCADGADMFTGDHPMHPRPRSMLLLFGVLLLSSLRLQAVGEFSLHLDGDPLRAVGHGAIIGADGVQLMPDREFILSAQDFYLDALLAAATALEPEHLQAFDRVQGTVDESVPDRVLANALLIEWLATRISSADAARVGMSAGALRNFYIEKFIAVEGPLSLLLRSRGLGIELAQKLEQKGVLVLPDVESVNAQYLQQCRDAGVPIPPPIRSAGWSEPVEIAGEFLVPDAKAELMIHQSTEPEGVCMTLPRFGPLEEGGFSNNASLNGLICLGYESSNACFWDRRRGEIYPRDEEIAIERLDSVAVLGGDAGVCSDCHAGQNPFIVHPDKPAFANLPRLNPVNWHQPLVPSNWPVNPGPTALLDAVPSTQQCSGCHQAGATAGPFPDVSRLPQYCSMVLANAMDAAASGTMPPAGWDRNDFMNHIEALRRACRTPPIHGKTVLSEYTDDPARISAPLVIGPLYGCATRVAVQGAVRGAEVVLQVNGRQAGRRQARDPAEEVFAIAPLRPGDRVEALQVFRGARSSWSPSVLVRDVRQDYPHGLPPPDIDPVLIHECANTIAVRHVPGAVLTAYRNGQAGGSLVTGTSWTAVRLGTSPFAVGESFAAEVSMCGASSPMSATQQAVKAPASVPTVMLEPNSVYEGQALLNFTNLLNGARVEPEIAGVGALRPVSTPISRYRNYDVERQLGRTLQSGDALTVRQSLCRTGDAPRVYRAQSCKDMPVPEIESPSPGDMEIVVNASLPDARVRVHDAFGEELGDGSGSVILLNRPIRAGDIITVIQQLGDCAGEDAYQVLVGNGDEG